MKKVVVVILSWRRQREVIALLQRIGSLTGADLEVVVVDNASGDGSVDAIRAAAPEVALIEAPGNGGFTGGVNRGLEEAQRRHADYAWLLNDDTVIDDDTLAKLLHFAGPRRDCGLLSPSVRMLGEPQRAQFSNGVVDWASGNLRQNLRPNDYVASLLQGATAVVPGTALLCDMAVYRAIGPFDERYFAYWEDTDYSIRAHQAGFGCAVVDAATVEHSGEAWHRRPPHYYYYMTRNEALFWRTHAPRAVPWRRQWLQRSLENIGRNRDAGNPLQATAGIDGIWHALRSRYGNRDRHPAAPAWLHRLVLARPFLWSSLAAGDVRSLIRRLLRRKR